MDAGIVSGATVILMRGDEILYKELFGSHNEDSIFCMYSMTKVITSIACLQLAEQGLLHLDDPVAKFLPSFQGGEQGQITVRQCLSHQAGFDYNTGLINPGLPMLTSYRNMFATLSNNLRGYVDSYMVTQPLLFRPGAAFNYADGANVAAAVVEELSGLSFAEYVRRHITEPLGMEDTTFRTSRAQRKRYAPMHYDLAAIQHPLPVALRWLRRFGVRRLRAPLLLADFHLFRHMARGDAGLKSTSSDWTKLVQALLRGGSAADGARLLSDESVAQIGTSALPDGASLVPPFAMAAAPQTAAPQFGMLPEQIAAAEAVGIRGANSFQGQACGLGVNVVLDPAASALDKRAKGTCWWMGFASTFFSYNCEAGIGCLVLAQEMNCFRRMPLLAQAINTAHALGEGEGGGGGGDAE